MFKRFALLLVLTLTASFALSACSATDNKHLSGQAAQDALHAVVENSVKKLKAEGGSETLAVGQTQYVVIYDPSAAEGKQVVTANLTNNSAATFDKISSVSLLALADLIATDTVKKADVSLTKNVFTVQGKDFLFEIFVTDDLVYKSNIWSSQSGSQDAQIVVITYGINADTQKLFDSAVEPAPAQ
ncbi:hypothetical protein [Aurantimicrobium minutum]|uniref:hypothetical protein n=1 Tax=Aurantimicrobium minutum TaxID=708131 RepID=UPI00247507D0|nr:hypothetical protein [Aurantimicrobium minutum]MDH6422959.1 hypothetical protein [Aurantimicrobium minutum]